MALVPSVPLDVGLVALDFPDMIRDTFALGRRKSRTRKCLGKKGPG